VALLLLVALAVAVAIVALSGGGGQNAHRKRSPHPSSKPAPTSTAVQVPQVVGLSFTDAVAQLTGAGLAYKVHPVKGPLGTVLGVRPDVGSALNPGDSVTLYVGNGHGHGKGNGNGND
jgi:hypothetical protein